MHDDSHNDPQPLGPRRTPSSWEEAARDTAMQPTSDPSRRLPTAAAPAQARRSVSPWVPVVGGCLMAVAALTALLVAGAGVLYALELRSEPERATVTRSFAVTGTPTVTLQVDAENVRVVRGDAGQVMVRLTKEVRAISHQQAQRDLAAITLDASQTGDRIEIRSHLTPFHVFPTYLTRASELVVTVPQATNLDASLQAGNFDAAELMGTCAVTVSAGNLTLERMTFTDQATLHVGAGNLSATDITGGLTATADFGDLRLRDATVTHSSTMRVSAGDLDFDGSLAPGVSLDVLDNAGDVSLALPRATDVHLDATANVGSVSVSGWSISQSNSGVGAHAEGDLSAQPTGAVTIRVDAGDITLTTR